MYVTRSRAIRAAAFILPVLVAATVQASDKGQPLDAQKAGIPVYPGATADAGTSDFVRNQLGMTATAFRTSDDLAKVIAFYGKQPGIKAMAEPNKEGAAYSAGCKDVYNSVMKKNMATCPYQVTVQSPWMDMKTGKMVKDTLITIVHQPK